MLEITSNFRISIDLFELVRIISDKATAGYAGVALRYFGPFEMMDTLVYFSENLTLQNAPGTKIQRIEIRKFWWPNCAVEMKRGTSFLSHSWLTRAECGSAESRQGYLLSEFLPEIC